MDDKLRRRVLIWLCSTSIIQFIIGAVQFMLALLSRSNHGEYNPGVPPYYTGAFICMTTVILHGILGVAIYYRGKSCVNKNDVVRRVGCLIQAYSMVAIISVLGYITSALLVGFNGICQSENCSYLTNVNENRRFAISILVFILFGFISSAIGLAVLVVYSSHFGFKILSRGQYKISQLDEQTVTNIEETPVVELTPNHPEVSENHTHQNHHRQPHPDPRPQFPPPNFSPEHVSHFLTQQYRDRIRKRKKKTKKTNKESKSTSRKKNGRNNRCAPYQLPPLASLSQRFPELKAENRIPPRETPSPPPAPVIYPPPSPSNSPSPTLVSPSSVPVPEITRTSASPLPWSLSPSPPPPPPSPPMDYLRVVHVIPCGEYLDDESSVYSCA